MTTEMAAALFASVAIEDYTARELAQALEDITMALLESATTLRDLADSCDESEEERELADRFQGEADANGDAAQELAVWSGHLRAALAVPPDQRQAIY
jgi:hypothetical protein